MQIHLRRVSLRAWRWSHMCDRWLRCASEIARALAGHWRERIRRCCMLRKRIWLSWVAEGVVTSRYECLTWVMIRVGVAC